MDAKVNRRRW